jgi:hypothetical protein
MTRNESKEIFVIVLTYTASDPNTMMVKTRNANVTDFAML